MEPIKVYICCKLTKASPALVEKVKAIKSALAEHMPFCKVLDFFGLGPSPSDGAVFLYDMAKVEESDLIVVVCDEDTWGGGIEIGVAYKIGKPVLFFAPESWIKTRMITGPCELYPEQFMMFRYPDQKADVFVTSAVRVAIDHFHMYLSRSERDTRQLAMVMKRDNPIFGREAPVYSGSFEKLPPLEKESGPGPKQMPERVAGYGYEDIGGSPVQEGYEKTRTSGWKS